MHILQAQCCKYATNQKPLTQTTTMLEDIFDTDMATEESKKLAKEMCYLMKEIRESKPLSIRSLCSKKEHMDFTVLSRAEAYNEDNKGVPTLAFWLDWCEVLEVEISDIIKRAKIRLK